MSLGALGTVLVAQGKYAEARPHLERAVGMHDSVDMGPHQRAESTAALVTAWTELGVEKAKAKEAAQRALDDYRAAGESFKKEAAELEAWLQSHS